MRQFSHFLLSSFVAGSILTTAVHAAASPTTTPAFEPGTYNVQGEIDVSVPPKYGRSATEYFITPIVGLNYIDITQISTSLFESDEFMIGGGNGNNNGGGGGSISTEKTQLGGVLGLLLDAQYQITSTDYWRGGFQTGLTYTSPVETRFETLICPVQNCNNGANSFTQEGTLETSSWQVPLLFTLSRYAANDRYIITLKLGPSLVYQMYDMDFDGFEIEPDDEEQIIFTIGLDGRFRLGESDNFLLVGFQGDNPFGNGNNNTFSGVNTVNAFLVYLGFSFS